MKIGRYEVVGEIARGGMGVVLRGRDDALRREVAIKVLLAGVTANEIQRKRFEREVNALARLRHPNIVLVHEAGFTREGPFVVMDFIDGESLEGRLERTGPLPLREALRLMETVACAIAYAHSQNVLHRDLKPANIIVDREGVPHVTDFGLARDVDPRASVAALSRSGVSIGTPGFWPPEQAYGHMSKVGPPSDVYGLGATLYALITGEPPYDAPSLIEVLGLMAAPVRPPSDLREEVSPALDAVVLRAMAHEPEDRFPSAAAFAEALADARRRTIPADPRRRHGVLGGVAALVALGGVALSVVHVLGRDGEARDDAAVVATSTPPPPAPPVPLATEVAPASVDPATEAFEAAKAAHAAGRPIEARETVGRALAARPDFVDAFVLRALLRTEAADHAGAEEDLSVALALAPDRIDVRYARALARRALADASGVVEDTTIVLDAAPDDAMRAEAFAQRAWARGKLDDSQRAIEDWTEAIVLRPSAEWLVEIGNVEFELGDLDTAHEDFSRALMLDPDDVLARLNRAAVYTKRGKGPEAIADLDHAAKTHPDLPMVWFRRGDARRLEGDNEGALADMNRAVELDPGNSEHWRVRGVVRMNLGDNRGGVEDLRQVLARDPDHGQARAKLGLALHRLGDSKAGLVELDEAIRRHPAAPDLHMDRAIICDESGDRERARAGYDRTIELAPDDWRPYYNRGMLRGSDDYPGALADYDRVEALGGADADLYLNRGDLRRRMDDAAGAVADLERALALDPNLKKVHLALGMAYHLRKGEGDLKRADVELSLHLDTMLETDPQFPRFLAERGLVRKAMGDVEGASSDFKRVLELVKSPDDPLRRYALARLKELGATE